MSPRLITVIAVVVLHHHQEKLDGPKTLYANFSERVIVGMVIIVPIAIMQLIHVVALNYANSIKMGIVKRVFIVLYFMENICKFLIV